MDINLQYNTIGRDYVLGQKEFFSKRKDEAIEFIKKSLPNLKNKKIIDVGCGNGKDIRLLESLGSSDVYGIDASEFMINESKKIVSNPKNLFVGNIEETLFEDNFFDVAIGRFSFHYLSDFDKAYQELSRILKKGGLLILVVHHPFRDLIRQKNKLYGKQEIVKVELYDNNVPIHLPTHTLKDYFSEKFFEYFCLSGYEEDQSPEESTRELKVPGFMGIKATKK